MAIVGSAMGGFFRKCVVVAVLVSFCSMASAVSGPMNLLKSSFAVYSEDVNAAGIGQDGIPDLVFQPPERVVVFGVPVFIFLKKPPILAPLVLCGNTDGSYQTCQLASGYQPSYNTPATNVIEYASDFDGNGYSDLYLHSTDATKNSLIITAADGVASLQQQFNKVMGIAVSGIPVTNISIQDNYGISGRSEIVIKSTYYVQVLSSGMHGGNTDGSMVSFYSTPFSGVAFATSSPSSTTADEITPINSGVSANGGLRIDIPFVLPTWREDLTPRLGVHVGSGTAVGEVGLGGSLSGLSEIRRCVDPKLVNGGSAPVAVTFTNADRLCLDGEYLLPVNNTTNLANGAEYRPWRSGRTKVTQAGTGATATFTVYREDGLIAEYGKQVLIHGKAEPYRWLLTRVRDRFTNSVVYEYQSTPVFTGITSIRYFVGSAAGDAEIRFQWSDLPSYPLEFVGGGQHANTAVVSAIQYYYQGQNLLELRLGYQKTATDVPQLAFAQRCARGGLQCAQPASLTWQSSASGVALTPKQTNFSYDVVAGGDLATARLPNEPGHVIFGTTFNSMAYASAYFTGTNEDLSYNGYQLDGSFGATSSVYLPSDFKSRTQAVDIDLDGYDEIVFLAVRRANASSTGAPEKFSWLYFDPSGSGGGGVIKLLASWTPANDASSTPSVDKLYAADGGPVPAIADFSGDGKPDFILPVGNEWRLYLNPNTAPGQTVTLSGASVLWQVVPTVNSHLHVVDVDGNGRADIAYRSNTGDWALLKNITGTTGTLVGTSLDVSNSVWADVNQDGISDLIGRKYFSGGNVLAVWYGTGAGTFALEINEGRVFEDLIGTADSYYFYQSDATAPFRLADMNGDGRQDLVYLNYTGSSTYRVKYLPRSGNQFGPGQSTSVTVSGSAASITTEYENVYSSAFASVLASTYAGKWLAADIDGDGATDVASVLPPVYFPTFSPAQYSIARGAALSSPGIASTQYGLGQQLSVQYKGWWEAATDKSVAVAPALSFPHVSADYPRDVVTRLTYTLGGGVSRQEDYVYGVPRYRIDGIGFIGFEKTTQTNTWLVGGTAQPDTEKRITTYEMSAPAYIGLPRTIEQSAANKTVSITENYWNSVSPVSVVAQPYLKESRTQIYEPVAGGAQPTALRASRYEAVAVSTYGHPTVELSHDGVSEMVGASRGSSSALLGGYMHQRNVSSSYLGDDTTNWLLGRLTADDSYDSLAGNPTGTAVTRDPSYDYKPGTMTCDSITTAGGLHFRDFMFDANGNIIQTDHYYPEIVIGGDDYFLEFDPKGYARPNQIKVDPGTGVDHHMWTYRGWDRGMDLLNFETLPSGEHTAYEYDFLGRATKSRKASYSQDNVFIDTLIDRVRCSGACGGHPDAVRYVQTTQPDNHVVTEYFDARNNLVQRSETIWPGKVASVYYGYDQRDRRIRVSVPVIGAMPAAGATGTWNTTTYDQYGRVIQTATADGVATAFAYTLSGGVLQRQSTVTRPLAAGGSTVEVSYDWTDALGNVVKTQDAAGTYTTYTYNAAGSPLVTKVNVTASGSVITGTETAAGTATYTNTYDTYGLPYSTNEPNAGTTYIAARTAFGPQTVYTPGGIQTRTLRENQGRPFFESVSDNGGASFRITRTYRYGKDAAGRLCKGDQLCEVQVLNEGVTSYSRYYYGPRGDLQSRDDVVDGRTYTFQYIYDDKNRLDKIGFPNNVNVDYGYNSVGVLASATYANTVGGTQQPAWSVSDVDARGLPLGETLAGTTVTSSWSTTTGLLSSRTASAQSGANLFSQTYGYDGGARLANRQVQRNTSTIVNESFGYDALSRLTTQNGAAKFTYDALGNIRWQSGLGHYRYDPAKPNAVTRRVDDSDVQLEAYTYNTTTGNRTGSAGTATTFTVDNKLASSVAGGVTRSYLYGLDHDWQKETTSIGGQSLERVQLQGGLYKRVKLGDTYKEYIDLGHGVQHVHEYGLDGSGATLYTIDKTVTRINDLLGSTLGTFDASGNTIEDRWYTAFGDQKKADGSDAPAPTSALGMFDDDILNGYTGHHQLTEGDLVHMGGRAYDAKLGRFLSVDPAYQSPYFTQSWNRYSYAVNSPYMYTDPSGYAEELLPAEESIPIDQMVERQLNNHVDYFYRGGFQAKANEEIIDSAKSGIWMFFVGRVTALFGRSSSGLPAKEVNSVKYGEGAFSLVGANRAIIDPRKLTEYALDPSHPVGGNKASVFASVLGYTKNNADDLMAQLKQGVMKNPAVVGRVDQYGSRFTVDILVTGPAGSGVVRTGWIYKTGSDVPELTTLFVK